MAEDEDIPRRGVRDAAACLGRTLLADATITGCLV